MIKTHFKTKLAHTAKKARRIFLLKNLLTLAPSRSENPFLRYALVSNGFEMSFNAYVD